MFSVYSDLFISLNLSVITLIYLIGPASLSYNKLKRRTMEKLHPFLFHSSPNECFFPQCLSVWFNISSKIATSDVHVLPVCVFSACWGPLIMNAESRGLWMEALRASDRQRIIEDRAQQTHWSGFSRRCSVCVYMCTAMWRLPTFPLVHWWN